MMRLLALTGLIGMAFIAQACHPGINDGAYIASLAGDNMKEVMTDLKECAKFPIEWSEKMHESDLGKCLIDIKNAYLTNPDVTDKWNTDVFCMYEREKWGDLCSGEAPIRPTDVVTFLAGVFNVNVMKECSKDEKRGDEEDGYCRKNLAFHYCRYSESLKDYENCFCWYTGNDSDDSDDDKRSMISKPAHFFKKMLASHPNTATRTLSKSLGLKQLFDKLRSVKK